MARWLSFCLPVLMVAGCQRPHPRRALPPTSPPARLNRPSAVSKDYGTHVELRDSQGRLLWTASARTSTASVSEPASGVVEMQGVTWTLYHNGKPAWRLSAASLRATQQNRQIVMSGGVSAQSADGITRFTAPTVTWSAQTQTLTAPGNVVLQFGRTTVRGRGLVANTVNGGWRMEGPGAASLGR